MWIQSTSGLYSIVRKGAPGEYQVRARVRGDLDNLIKVAKLHGQKIVQSNGSDYAYRLIISKAELTSIVLALADGITYGNFKSAVGATKGQEKHANIYHQAWGLFAKLQPGGAYSGGHSRQKNLFDGDDWYAKVFGHPATPKPEPLGETWGADDPFADVEPPKHAVVHSKSACGGCGSTNHVINGCCDGCWAEYQKSAYTSSAAFLEDKRNTLAAKDKVEREETLDERLDRIANERIASQMLGIAPGVERSLRAREVGRRVNNLRRYNEWLHSGTHLTYAAWKAQATSPKDHAAYGGV